MVNDSVLHCVLRLRGGGSEFVHLIEEHRNKPKTGTSNAARISKGKLATENILANKRPNRKIKFERHPDEHITVTVVLYHTVLGGVPSSKDVIAAIDEMEYLYSQCNKVGQLVDSEFNFMKQKK